MHLEAGGARARRQRVELAEARLRSEPRLGAVADEAERAPQLGQRFAAGLADGAERVGRGGRVAVGQALPGAGLDRDHADRVGEHVVHLARDVRALALGGQARTRFAFLSQLLA